MPGDVTFEINDGVTRLQVTIDVVVCCMCVSMKIIVCLCLRVQIEHELANRCDVDASRVSVSPGQEVYKLRRNKTKGVKFKRLLAPVVYVVVRGSVLCVCCLTHCALAHHVSWHPENVCQWRDEHPGWEPTWGELIKV